MARPSFRFQTAACGLRLLTIRADSELDFQASRSSSLALVRCESPGAGRYKKVTKFSASDSFGVDDPHQKKSYIEAKRIAGHPMARSAKMNRLRAFEHQRRHRAVHSAFQCLSRHALKDVRLAQLARAWTACKAHRDAVREAKRRIARRVWLLRQPTAYVVL